MYRPKDYIEETVEDKASKPITAPHLETYLYPSPYSTTTTLNKTTNNNDSFNKSSQIEPPLIQETVRFIENERIDKPPARFEAPPPPPLVEAKIDVMPQYSPVKENTAQPESSRGTTKEFTHDMDYESQEHKKTDVNKEVTYDMDYQPDNEDIDYDEDDIYDDEEGQDNDSEDLDDEDLLDDDDESVEEGEDASDVDDTELMKRLEAKYGKLPANEYESDEDPEDPSWTRNY